MIFHTQNFFSGYNLSNSSPRKDSIMKKPKQIFARFATIWKCKMNSYGGLWPTLSPIPLSPLLCRTDRPAG